MGMSRWAGLLVCTGLLAGCAWPTSQFAEDPGRAARVAGVPFHAQEGFRCGPASMASMLGWAGVDVAPATLQGRFYGDIKDPRRTLIDTARHYGRLAYPISGLDAAMAELSAGHPVLILQNLGVAREPIWNCMVATGYDRALGQMTVQSGGDPNKTMSFRLVERLWSDTDGWGLVVLRPGEVPATASEQPYVDAILGLQKAGHYWEAVLAYDSALAQWPGDDDALMGLGSSLYLLGDIEGARDAFQAALKVARDPRKAQEALTHVLAELARPDAVKAAARRSAAIATPTPARYE